MTTRRQFTQAAAASVLGALPASLVRAQATPLLDTLRMIVGFPPGGKPTIMRRVSSRGVACARTRLAGRALKTLAAAAAWVNWRRVVMRGSWEGWGEAANREKCGKSAGTVRESWRKLGTTWGSLGKEGLAIKTDKAAKGFTRSGQGFPGGGAKA